MNKPINFSSINQAALDHFPGLLMGWLPGGKIQGSEYVTRNPLRDDHKPGSFSVNLKNGAWADFALGEASARGGDVTSLYGYLHGLRPGLAARELARLLGVPDGR